MRRFLQHVPLALSLLALSVVTGCRSAPPAPNGPLRIGVLADSPPLVFLEGGNWQGIEADLGRAFAARLGMNPVFMACAPGQLEAALLDGKVDVLMGGTTLSEDRRVQMDFASPYLVVGQAALIRSADLSRYNTPIKIRSTKDRVGVIDGSTGDRYVSRYFTYASRVPFSDAEEAAAALREKKIDLLIHDAPAVWWLSLRQGTSFSLAPALFAREEVAWAFRRSSVALRESANQALADWQKDGTLESVLKRWIPFSK